MRIESSDIHMNARSTDYEHQKVQVSIKQEKVILFGDRMDEPKEGDPSEMTAKEALRDYRRSMEAIKPPKAIELNEKEVREISAIERLISMLLGKEFRFHEPYINEIQPSAYGGAIADIVGGAQWTHQVVDTSVEYYRESEVVFEAGGKVTTVDGREIDIALHLSEKRSLSITIKSRQETWSKPKDPLVLQFNGAFPELSDKTMTFDIDFDGKEDQIHQLTAGSGFLVYDKNGDGRINDGSELFGTRTGDGFRELAAFDSDDNKWIDENDPIFSKLRIWMGDDEGNRKLIGLGQLGVGAIYVGHLDTYFEQMDDAYHKLGAIQKSGIYLTEDGEVANIHHLDFYV